MQCRWTVNHTTCCCLSWLHIYIVDRIFFQTQGINKILLIYINFSFDFLSQNHLISLGFLMNMNVYMHSDHMLFTTFAFVYIYIYIYICIYVYIVISICNSMISSAICTNEVFKDLKIHLIIHSFVSTTEVKQCILITKIVNLHCSLKLHCCQPMRIEQFFYVYI